MKTPAKYLSGHLTLVLLFFHSLISAQFINIRQGSMVQMDGQIDAVEWQDADSILIDLNSVTKVTVKFKHDGSNFNFVFLNNLESFNIRFPEILLDINNDKSANWQTDDWWFHVSATDCESNTAANDYSNCLLIQPEWIALNNFTNGPPMTDTVEIQIPFSKVNFTTTTTDTIGLAFDVTNTFSAWNFWPGSAVNSMNPSTWGSAIIEFNTTAITSIKETPFEIITYPNPVKGNLYITLAAKEVKSFILQLRDLRGKLIKKMSMNESNGNHVISMPLDDIKPGYYTLECIAGEFCKSIKVIKL